MCSIVPPFSIDGVVGTFVVSWKLQLWILNLFVEVVAAMVAVAYLFTFGFIWLS